MINLHAETKADLDHAMQVLKGVLRVAVCCSVLQCVAVCCRVLHCVAVDPDHDIRVLSSELFYNVLQCVCSICCGFL